MSDLVTAEATGTTASRGGPAPVPAGLRHDQRAHLYGFPSPDSDYDLRGCHVLPVREVVGLDVGRETVEISTTRTTASSWIWSRTTPGSSSACC